MNKDEKKVEEVLDPIDAILSDDNDDNVVLYNDKDEAVEFEQVAVIPHDEKIYAILKPVNKMEGVAEDEGMAFEIVLDEENGDTLKVVEDDKLIDEIFKVYTNLIDEEK